MCNLYKSQFNVHEGKTHSKLRCLWGLSTHKAHMFIETIVVDTKARGHLSNGDLSSG